MKITEVVQTTETVTKDILCNKCGESCRTNEGDGHKEFDGLIEVKVMGGYWSKVIGDQNYFEFSLCESCLVVLANTFKINAFCNSDDCWQDFNTNS